MIYVIPFLTLFAAGEITFTVKDVSGFGRRPAGVRIYWRTLDEGAILEMIVESSRTDTFALGWMFKAQVSKMHLRNDSGNF